MYASIVSCCWFLVKNFLRLTIKFFFGGQYSSSFRKSAFTVISSSLVPPPSFIFSFHVKGLNISLPLSPIWIRLLNVITLQLDITALRYNCIICFQYLHVAVKFPESKFISVIFGSRCSILVSLIQSKFDDFFHSWYHVIYPVRMWVNSSYIVSTNCLVWCNYSNYNIFKSTINIFSIIVWETIFPAVRNNNLKTRGVW